MIFGVLCWVLGVLCLVFGVLCLVAGNCAGDGYLDGPVSGVVVMVDDYDLLPGSQTQPTVSHRDSNGRAQKGCLDMAVPVTVMPGLFMRIGHTRWRPSMNCFLQIFYDTRFELNRRYGTCGAHSICTENTIFYC